MTITIKLLDPQLHPNAPPHRIAPVRFARAVSGLTQASAPDVDDRGFVAVPNCTARGPVVGVRRGRTRAGSVAPGPTAHVRVVRDRIDRAARLFCTVDDPSIVEIVFPPQNTPLSPDETPAAGGEPARHGDTVYFRSVSTARTTQETKIKVRHGSGDDSGKVLAEMSVRAIPVLRVPVQVHRVTINGRAAGVAQNGLDQLFERVNAIYAPAGVFFDHGTGWIEQSVTGFANAGQTGEIEEEAQVTRTGQDNDALNVWVVPRFHDGNTLGRGISHSLARGALGPDPSWGFVGYQVGLLCSASGNLDAIAHIAAHEIGHVLDLEHYGGGQTTTHDVRNDIWAHRSLMWNALALPTDNTGLLAGNRFSATPARAEVGYGDWAAGFPRTGQMLGIKRLRHVSQSDQVSHLRDAVLAHRYRPV